MYKFLDRGCSVSAEKANTEVKKTKLRTFDDSYIKYDLLWNIVMAKHIDVTTIHPEHANKSKDFFQRKKEEYVKQTVRLTNTSRQYTRKHSKHRILQPCI